MSNKLIESIKKFRRRFGSQLSPLWLREQLKNIDNNINHIKDSIDNYIKDNLNLSLYMRGIYNKEFCKSQFGQDIFVTNFFNNKTQGIFFEAGAFNGKDLSNTYYLEKTLLWTGILIEPIMEYYEDIKNHRNDDTIRLHAALSANDKEKITLRKAGAVSNVENIELSSDNEITIGRTLSSVFDEFNISHIDYFSLDIEGHELVALKTIDFKKVNITLCGIESNDYKNAKEIHEFMLSKNFNFIKRIGVDYFYVNNDYKM